MSASAKKAKIDSSKPNHELAEMLYEIADFEKNVNRQVYKYNAYRKAARAIIDHPTKIKTLKEAEKLEGVGKKILEKIGQYLEKGMINKLEKVRGSEDAHIINELVRITGIGPAHARKLHEEGINSIEDLEKNKDKLTHHQKIGLKYYIDFEQKIPREEMIKMRDILVNTVKEIGAEYEAEICGSFRRGVASSGDIDLLLTHPKYVSIDDVTDKKHREKNKEIAHELMKPIVEKLEKINFITDTIAFGDTKFMGVCHLEADKPFRRLDIRLIPKDQYYCGVLYFTGSDMFNKNMRHIALEKGFTLNEYSLRKLNKQGIPGKPKIVHCEKDIFDFLGMEYKKPEERNM